MKQWTYSISAIVILASIIMIILPNGRTSTIIKSIFSLVIMLVIISPIKSLTNKEYTFENMFEENNLIIQEDYLEYITQKKLYIYKENVIKILENLGIKNATFEYEYTVSDLYEISFNKVFINLKNSVIQSENNHIIITENIKNSLSEYLEINKEFIEIYD